MTPRTKKTAAALSGALVLASGAYALGSQTGDGQALAGQNANAARQGGYGFGYGPGPGKHGFRGGPRQDLADAAKQARRLAGQAPRRAEEPARRPQGQARRPPRRVRAGARQAARHPRVQGREPRSTSATAPTRKLKRDGHRGDMRDAFAKQLAAKLGIDAAKVRSALDALRKAGPPGRRLSALASKLGVTEAKLRDALQRCAPRLGRPRPRASPASTAAAPATRSSARSPRSSASARPSSSRAEGHPRRPEGSSATRRRQFRGRSRQGARRLEGQGRRRHRAPSAIMGGVVRSDPLVLVVDDEATVRQALERALRLEGFAVATAAGGARRSRPSRSSPPAVIVLDVTMPDLDGVSVVRAAARRRHRRRPSASSPRATRSRTASPACRPAPTTTWSSRSRSPS